MLEEIKGSDGEVVTFIDELHTVVGAGAAEGSMDAGNMLKPMLARGELRMVGATTLDEFREHLGGAPDMDVFWSVLRKVESLGWHVVLHFDAIDLVTHESLLDSLPVPYIIDHMGRVPTRDGLDQEPFAILLEFAKRDNCWVKVCGAERISAMGPPFTDAIPFAQKLIETAPDRVLWGTDWPHPNIKEHMPNDGDLVDLIPLMTESLGLQQKLLVDNPQRLYGFDNK